MCFVLYELVEGAPNQNHYYSHDSRRRRKLRRRIKCGVHKKKEVSLCYALPTYSNMMSARLKLKALKLIGNETKSNF